MKNFVLLFALVSLVSCGKDTKTKTKLVSAPVVDSRLSCDVFEVLGASALPDFSTLTSLGSVRVSELDNLSSNTTDMFKSFQGTDFENLVEQFGLVCKGKMKIKTSGNYNFQLLSDDGSRLLIDGVEVIANNGLHSATTKSATVFLLAGAEVNLEVQYFNNFGQKALRLAVKKPGASLTETLKF